jgi:hypothetical protein
MVDKLPNARKSARTANCVNKKGGSDCVGASSFRAGTFSNDSTTNTKKLRQSASGVDRHMKAVARCDGNRP